jgi:hypothetical protein
MATGNRGERSKWPARINDVRSKFASDAPAAGVSVFELARIMGSSVRIIERHYRALLDGAGAGSPRDCMRSTRGPTFNPMAASNESAIQSPKGRTKT